LLVGSNIHQFMLTVIFEIFTYSFYAVVHSCWQTCKNFNNL